MKYLPRYLTLSHRDNMVDLKIDDVYEQTGAAVYDVRPPAPPSLATRQMTGWEFLLDGPLDSTVQGYVIYQTRR